MSKLAKQDILRLEVSVNDLVFMQKLQGQNNLASKKPNLLLLKPFVEFEMVEQRAAWLEIEQQIQVVLALKGQMQLKQKRMLEVDHDLFFVFDILEVVF